MTRRPERRDRREPSTLLTVAGPALLAAALTAIALSSRSLWLDEGATVAIASQHGDALWQAIAHDGGNMLAYYLLEHVLIGLFGAGELVIRLPSVLAVGATVGVTAALGLRLFGRRVALAAGALAMVSLPLIFWGQDARGYALMVAFSSGSFLALLSLLDAPADAPLPRRALLAYGVCTLIALYLGFVAILVLPAQLLLLARSPRRALPVVGVLSAVALACVPLLVLALQRGSSQLFWVPHPGLSVLKQAGVTLTSTGMPPNFHPTGTTTPGLIFTGALIVLAIAGTVLSVVRGRTGVRALLPAAWFAVPLVLGLLASEAGQPIELARGSVLLIPAVALLLASGLTHRSLATARLARGAGWFGLAIVLVLRLIQLLPSYGTSPENWRAATAFVLRAERPASCIAFYPEDARMPFDYYVRSRSGPDAGDHAVRLPRPVLPALPFSQVHPFVERYVVPSSRQLARISAACPQLWLIASHDGQRHGPPASRRDYHRYEGMRAELARHYSHSSRRLFGYAAVIRVVVYTR